MRAVKGDIEQVWGMPSYRQDLFVLDEDPEGGSSAGSPLPDGIEIPEGFVLALYAREAGRG